MVARLMAAWRWLPALIRAPIVAFIVLNIGSTAGVLPVFANTKFLPQVPWALPATSLVMVGFWFYFTGRGYPAATRSSRQHATRLKSLPGPIWRAAVLPLLLSIVTVTSLRLALPSILPVEAPKIALDLGDYPFATVIGLLLSVALTAGVAEEVAFRGYLQKPLEESYGLIPALILTGVAFWLAHADKVALSHLPFHLVASVLLGLSAYLTRSLLPAIIGHALADALLLPAYAFHKPAFIWSSLAARPLWESAGVSTLGERLHVVFRALEPSRLLEPGLPRIFAIATWVFLVSAALTSVALVRLARVARRVWPDVAQAPDLEPASTAT
ncbi:MAG TPA: type II CAAX endopeptidase family protein [Thermoanaerobaculia bacterium]